MIQGNRGDGEAEALRVDEETQQQHPQKDRHPGTAGAQRGLYFTEIGTYLHFPMWFSCVHISRVFIENGEHSRHT
jgi:hypothetical protein